MKKWENAELVTVAISNTENGGNISKDYDQSWLDQNNALHVNFVDDTNHNS